MNGCWSLIKEMKKTWWSFLAEFGPIRRPKIGPFGGRISAHLLAEFGPIRRPKFAPFGGRSLAGPFGGRSSKFFISFLTTFGLIFGLIFGLSKQTKFRASLQEQKCTGNSGPIFSCFGSDFRENTPDFENATGMHCLSVHGFHI